MDAQVRTRMLARARRAMFYAALNGAYGHCTEEEDPSRGIPRVIERSLYDALYVARNPLGNSPAEMALRERARNSKDQKELRFIAELFSCDPPERFFRERKVKLVKDFTDSRYLLPKRRFFIEREAGVSELLGRSDVSGITDKRAAEIEWMKRQAELETGVVRDEPDHARRKRFENAYDALRQHDYR